MAIYLFALISSFILNAVLIVPFINQLYKWKFQRSSQETRDPFNNRTPIFDKFHGHKAGTPVGGGLLIVMTTLVLMTTFLMTFLFWKIPLISNYNNIVSELKIVLFTFVSFAFLGFYDDFRKLFKFSNGVFWGLRIRHKLLIELLLAFVISYWMVHDLRIRIVYVPFFGVFNLSYLYIIFSTFVIVSFANAVNITDGLDGLVSGLLLIALIVFWVISQSILDTPMSLFISIWIGGLIAFLYFNIHPARIWLGDTGALSFGATFAVIGLLLGKSFSLIIIGGFFVAEITMSFVQIVGKKYLKRKIFPVSPLHLFLQYKGWEEPKIVMRAWLTGILFAIFGLMIAFMR